MINLKKAHFLLQNLSIGGESKGSDAKIAIGECYEKVVFWKKNLFMLPNGAAGKNFIREATRLLNAWIDDSLIKPICMKAIHIMPALLLQKPFKNSKSKDHSKALERRLEKWHQGKFQELYEEAETIQQRLSKPSRKNDIASISKRFKDHMQRGNVNAAIRLLTDNMSHGILPLNKETLGLLIQKHPESEEATKDVILQGPIKEANPIVFETIDESLILKSAQATKGGSGPSGMDADGWRKPLTSKVYGDCGVDLRTALANFTKRVCREDVCDDSLEAFIACRLIPLDKNPGLRPIGVGEVLRRICGKAVMSVVKQDIVNSSCKVQMCSGQSSGSEAAIHAMRDLFEEEESEAVLLVDAANAFNSINRNAFLHNINILCPTFAKYAGNCYRIPSRLFVIGGYELISSEGTTQGDPLGMAIYAIGLTPLLEMMMEIVINIKSAVFADDLTSIGMCHKVEWWNYLSEEGPKIGYNPQPTKSWLIVKPQFEAKVRQLFMGSNIQISTRGERHLGACLLYTSPSPRDRG